MYMCVYPTLSSSHFVYSHFVYFHFVYCYYFSNSSEHYFLCFTNVTMINMIFPKKKKTYVDKMGVTEIGVITQYFKIYKAFKL